MSICQFCHQDFAEYEAIKTSKAQMMVTATVTFFGQFHWMICHDLLFSDFLGDLCPTHSPFQGATHRENAQVGYFTGHWSTASKMYQEQFEVHGKQQNG